MSGLPAEKYVAPDPAGTGIVEPVPDTAVIPEIRNLGIISVGVMEDRCLDVQTSDMALGRGHSHEGIFSPGKKRRPRDWRRDFRHPSAELPEEPANSDIENAVNIDKEDDIDELKAKIRRLRESNEKYREDLYQIRREMETVKERTENVEKRAAAERTELAELRELVFTQANAVEMGGLEPDKAAELRFPYSTRKRVVVFGGHDSWRKAIRPLLPNVTFINREQRPNADMIKAADVVWIQPNALSHRSFYKIINVVRTNQVQIRYFGYASAMKCAVQVLEDDVPTGKS